MSEAKQKRIHNTTTPRRLGRVVSVYSASAVVVAMLFGLFIGPVAHADVESVLPSFYAEPGFHDRWRQKSSTVNEHIDPFSGSLQLSHVDLVVPGAGGLDIRVQRHYSSNIWLTRPNPFSIPPIPSVLLPSGPTGVGWTMHFGRVVKAARDDGFPDGICETNATNPGDTNQDNAVLELPDGSQDTLFVNQMLNDGVNLALFATKKGWIANCLGASQGLIVYSPDGLRYTMNHLEAAFDEATYTTRLNRAWYPTRIEDGNGNFITITYSGKRGSHALISQIAGSDGRLVTFGYTDGYLTSVTANNQTWTYVYSDIPGLVGRKQLRRVIRPDGLEWQYDYIASDAAVARNALQTVTYPYGATATYGYTHVDFSGNVALIGGDPSQKYLHVAVSSKVQGGREIQPGTWTYQYSPGTENSVEPGNDTTIVNFPGGRHVYKHFGMQRQLFIVSQVAPRELWKTGLLREKETYQFDSQGQPFLIQRESYTWQAPGALSFESYVGTPYDYIDFAVYFAQMTSKTIERDGTVYRSVYDYDCPLADGTPAWCVKPKLVRETGQVGAPNEVTRQTDLFWYPPRTRESTTPGVWKFDQILHEIVAGNDAFSTLREFDYATGNLTAIQPRGVVERFTYHPTGDVATRQNARGWITQFNNHHRGVPRQEIHPVSSVESFTVTRQVNNTGTVQSETNGRLNTTSYLYDDMNRPTFINEPLGADTSVTWDGIGRTVTRGNYQERTVFDGFGRVICVQSTDTARAESLTRITRYNALGHTIFTSQPFNGSCNASPPGDVIITDILGRPAQVTHPDLTEQRYQYQSDNRINITNERGLTTSYQYRSFGDPDKADEKVLLRIDAPEAVTTVFTRNIIGQPLSVSQGMSSGSGPILNPVTRTYSYAVTNNFLLNASNPETGTTIYTRDALGNMTSRQIGASPITTYVYDAQNRLRTVNYPGSEPDVSINYDANSNLTSLSTAAALVPNIVNFRTTRSYVYDQNDNLTSESLNVLGLLFLSGIPSVFEDRTFQATYAYNTLDHVSNIRYPTNMTVTFNPDAFGRPREVAPFVTNVDYHPTGQPSAIHYANGRTTTFELNNRQWTQRIATTGGVVDLIYQYDGRGNIRSITDGVDSQFSRNLDYDGIDRLITASGNWGAGSFTYDAVGNLLTQSLGGSNLSYNYDSQNRLQSISGSRAYTFTYDVYGNVASNGRHNFTYSNAGNLVSLSGQSSAGYLYDGNNLRVREADGSGTRYHFYARNGDLLGEYDSNTPKYKEYAYLGGRLIAMRAELGNVPPTANAGPDQTVSSGAGVTLSGSGTDSDGSIVSYQWTQIAGPAVTLLNANTATATFTAPSVTVSTLLTFRLTVTDNGGATASDTVNITVNPNQSPTANAGADATVVEGANVNLVGSGSDPDGTIVSFAWIQTAGPAVALTNANSANASFTAPSVSADTVLTFQLTVTDNNGATASDSVNITVLNVNQAPTAMAGLDQTVNEGTVVSLDGSGSFDPDGSIASYSWVQTAGPAVALTGANTAMASFTAPDVTTTTVLTFQLTVTDNDGATASDSVTVTVQDVTTPPGGDTTAPVTTSTVISVSFFGSRYSLVVLTVNEPATTTFRLIGTLQNVYGAQNTQNWQPYNNLFIVRYPSASTVRLEYYSVDSAGNQEATNVRILP